MLLKLLKYSTQLLGLQTAAWLYELLYLFFAAQRRHAYQDFALKTICL